MFYFFPTCPYLYICNSCIFVCACVCVYVCVCVCVCVCVYVCIYIYICICMYVCMYVYIYIYIYIYVCMCMYVYIYIYILICTYLYFCILLFVFSVICMHQGVMRVTQFQFSVCMYGTCGRIDNKADFDFLTLTQQMKARFDPEPIRPQRRQRENS